MDEFTLRIEKWSFDADLQIVHADVFMEAGGTVLVDEPLCVDVGLPALLLSAVADTSPDRWAPPEEWKRVPFFVCGCGDPECRAFSFAVQHKDGVIQLTEMEERPGDSARELGTYEVEVKSYGRAVLAAGRDFLVFIKSCDYRPYYADTLRIVRERVDELQRELERN